MSVFGANAMPRSPMRDTAGLVDSQIRLAQTYLLWACLHHKQSANELPTRVRVYPALLVLQGTNEIMVKATRGIRDFCWGCSVTSDTRCLRCSQLADATALQVFGLLGGIVSSLVAARPLAAHV